MPRYNEQAQLIILNVLSFFEIEKQEVRIKGGDFNDLNFNNPFQRASEALKISIPTIHKIKKNGVQSDTTFAERLAKTTKKTKTKITEHMKHKIRDVIYRMYANKEYVTIASFHKEISEKRSGFFTYSISSLNR